MTQPSGYYRGQIEPAVMDERAFAEPPAIEPQFNTSAGPSPISTRPPGGQRTMILSWSDLMKQPPDPPPQIRPGIPRVGVTVIAGPPKVGKTLWTSQQALESGEPALLIVEEGDLAGLSYRLRRQAAELGIDEPQIHIAHGQRIRLDDRASLKGLRDIVARLRPAIVVFDPLNKLHSQDENRPTQMTPVMDALASIAFDFSCAVVAVHHLSKPNADRGGSVWDRVRGAGAIRSGTDANLALDGTGDHVRLVGEFRDAEPMSMSIELDREALLFREAEPPEAPAKVDPIELRAFVEERGQVTAAQICERFDVTKHTAIRALRALGCDERRESGRGMITFFLGTVQ